MNGFVALLSPFAVTQAFSIGQAAAARHIRCCTEYARVSVAPYTVCPVMDSEAAAQVDCARGADGHVEEAKRFQSH